MVPPDSAFQARPFRGLSRADVAPRRLLPSIICRSTTIWVREAGMVGGPAATARRPAHALEAAENVLQGIC